jgi:hypothetical protein
MCKDMYFEDFQVVRDVYLPEASVWLCDYPFLKRDKFERISAEEFRRRMHSGGPVRDPQW